MVALDGRLFQRSVHAFDLAVRPGMVHFRQPVLDFVFAAYAIEDMFERHGVRGSFGELNAVVGQDRVDLVRACLDQMAQELRGVHLAGLFVKLDEDELRRAVDGDEHVELAVLRADLGDVDMEVADRIGFELLSWRAFSLEVRHSGDVMALEQPVQT